MTTQILSRKARISAIITALVMLLTALCYTTRPTLASADVWDDDEFDIDYTHVCTAACYKNIYYLTDNPAAEYYVNTFLDGLVDMYAEQHTVFNEFKYYDLKAIDRATWREYISYDVRFGESKWYYDTHPIRDALVIYELNSMMPFQFADNEPYQPTAELYDTFLKMRSRNCRIMFICNTDELNFNDYDESNRFLDLVDVHVNTDIYSYFAETVLTKIVAGPISGTTIILDRSLCPYSVQGLEYKENNYKHMYGNNIYPRYGSRYEFLDGMLIPHIRKMTGFTRTRVYPNNIELINEEEINILCYIGDNIFFDIGGNSMYCPENDIYTFLDRYQSNGYYFIGSTQYGSNLTELRELLIDIEYEGGGLTIFDKYMFVEYGSYHAVEDEVNMKAAGLDNRDMAKFISPIVARFLFDDIYEVDWYELSNWSGRCPITIKPTDPDTWLLSDWEDAIGETEEREYYDDLD